MSTWIGQNIIVLEGVLLYMDIKTWHAVVYIIYK